MPTAALNPAAGRTVSFWDEMNKTGEPVYGPVPFLFPPGLDKGADLEKFHIFPGEITK